MEYQIRQLAQGDGGDLKALLGVFGEAFEDRETYLGAVPDDLYLNSLLGSPTFIAVVAVRDEEVVGGLAAYELPKFERNRREIYIYDLAVSAAHRRRGLARRMIAALGEIARARAAYVIYVQADRDDTPAIALYESLGTREDVHHFDIPVEE